jgi:hypothetical protein
VERHTTNGAEYGMTSFYKNLMSLLTEEQALLRLVSIP